MRCNVVIIIIIILKAQEKERKKEAIYDELIKFQAFPYEILDQMPLKYSFHIIEFLPISLSIWLLRLILVVTFQLQPTMIDF